MRWAPYQVGESCKQTKGGGKKKKTEDQPDAPDQDGEGHR